MNAVVPKTANNPSTGQLFSRFYGTAREGMADLLQALHVGPDDVILLPAFIGYSPREGSGVHDPVRLSGAQAHFYPVDDDLSPDLEAVRSMIAVPGVRAIVVIHYYGRTAAHLSDLRALADAGGVIFIEDLAHGFFTALNSGPAGRAGDVQLLSLHKMFPTPDGGMLRIRSAELARACRSTRPELAQFILDFDWRAIAGARRERFESLVALLERSPAFGTAFSLPWRTLSEHDVPQSLPVRILNGKRDEIYTAMNAHGFGVVSLYHTLISEVQAVHAPAVELSRQITNLPVHQDVALDAIEPMVRLFLETLQSVERP